MASGTTFLCIGMYIDDRGDLSNWEENDFVLRDAEKAKRVWKISISRVTPRDKSED